MWPNAAEWWWMLIAWWNSYLLCLVVSNMALMFRNIWDVILPIDELHHFSRWLFNHQPVMFLATWWYILGSTMVICWVGIQGQNFLMDFLSVFFGWPMVIFHGFCWDSIQGYWWCVGCFYGGIWWEPSRYGFCDHVHFSVAKLDFQRKRTLWMMDYDGLNTELSAVDGRIMLFHMFEKGCLNVRFGNRSKKSTFRLCSAGISGFQVYFLTPLEQAIRLQHEELALLQSSNINIQCLCLIGVV